MSEEANMDKYNDPRQEQNDDEYVCKVCGRKYPTAEQAAECAMENRAEQAITHNRHYNDDAEDDYWDDSADEPPYDDDPRDYSEEC